MDDLKNLLLGTAGGLLTLVLVWLFNHGRRRARVFAKAKAEAHAAWKRHTASGIKGDGFSALFHLHRALHVRLLSLGWLLGAGFCIFFSLACSRWPWASGLFLVMLQYCVFRFASLATKATLMVEIAEEAVSKIADEDVNPAQGE